MLNELFTMSHEQSAAESEDQADRFWETLDARFSNLSPNEFAALSRLANSDDENERPLAWDSLAEHLSSVTEHDAARAADLITALADSPFVENRRFLAVCGFQEGLTKVSHDIGISIWNRLMGDEDKEVRREAESLLSDVLDEHSDARADGFYMVEALHEVPLAAEHGLTRQDAYDLYLSYAYAENGEYFNLGRAALAKFQAFDQRVD